MLMRLIVVMLAVSAVPVLSAAQATAPPGSVVSEEPGSVVPEEPAGDAAASEEAVAPVVAADTPAAAVAAPSLASAVAAAPVTLSAVVAQVPTPAPAQPEETPVIADAPRARTVERPGRVRRAEAAMPSKGVNVRIDATVIESRGEQVTGRKMLTVTLVDGQWGSVRSSQMVAYQPRGSTTYNYRPAPLNMDARASIRDDGRITASLTLEYRGGSAEAGGAEETTRQGALDEGIRQNVTVLLESGKPLVVAQSADAVGDRRVSLEVKATVLK